MAAFFAGVSMPEPSPHPLHYSMLQAQGHSFASLSKSGH